jgi:hypothetical protein
MLIENPSHTWQERHSPLYQKHKNVSKKNTKPTVYTSSPPREETKEENLPVPLLGLLRGLFYCEPLAAEGTTHLANRC